MGHLGPCVTEPIAPRRARRKRPAPQDGRKRRRREWLRGLRYTRRGATRFDYHVENFLGFVHLGCLEKALLRCYS